MRLIQLMGAVWLLRLALVFARLAIRCRQFAREVDAASLALVAGADLLQERTSRAKLSRW